jgi:hypothetical protein
MRIEKKSYRQTREASSKKKGYQVEKEKRIQKSQKNQ